jgi:sugar porter (SP) family MFS transporter
MKQNTRGITNMGTDKDQGSGMYVMLLTFVAALGGLLFGYDTAVISGAIGFLKQRFALDANLQGWAASCALVGCIFGAMCAGVLSDKLGRKRGLMISAVLFAVSAIGSALPATLGQFVIARMLGGFGIGAASMLSPLYIAEISPARIRGRLVSVNQLAIVSGMLVVYFVNAGVARFGDSLGGEAWNVAFGWRWMFASAFLPSLVFLVLLFLVPESPRWLVVRGRVDEAMQVMSRVGGRRHAEQALAEIQETLGQDTASFSQLWSPGIRVAMLIGVVMAILQQVTGINVVLYYAPEIFKSAGLDSTRAIDQTVLVGLINMLFTVIAIWVVDRLGRKPLLLLGSAGMGISLCALGLAFIGHRFEGSLVLVFVLAYVASFAVAMGPIVWVVLSEIFPTRVRGTAMSVATVCLWCACFLVSQFFPIMLERLQGWCFFVYAAMCLVAIVFVAVAIPETKGRTLEEIERRWMKKS